MSEAIEPSCRTPKTVRISASVRAIADRLVEVRRDFHRHPEPAFKEVRTAGRVAARLHDLDWEVQTGVATTGVIGTLRRGAGPVVLLRFDMDALPVQEASALPYSSEAPGWMHACAHDAHTSIGLGLAELFSNTDFLGTIRLVFQPAEETLGGAREMIAQGALNDPDVDCCLGVHLVSWLPVGRVSARAGPVMASTDTLDVHIRGRGGHAANPHLTCDALLTGARIVETLHTIIGRNVDPFQPAVLSIGQFNAGAAPNVVAEEASLSGTVRAFCPTTRSSVIDSARRVVLGIASASGASVDFEVTEGCPPLVNDAEISQIVRKVASEVVGKAGSAHAPQWMAGEDFALFAASRPSCYCFVGAADSESGPAHPHHSPRFTIDEGAMLVAVEVLFRSSMALLDSLTVRAVPSKPLPGGHSILVGP